MAEEKTQTKPVSMSNTKKEMLGAYNALLKQLQEKREAELSRDLGSIDRNSKPEAPGF